MATTPKQIYIILCGGTGPRLWPLSTTSHPKQFIPILSEKSLIEQTLDRLSKITNPDNIYIATTQKNFVLLTKIAQKYISKQHLIIEPSKKNTATAIFFSLNYLNQLDSNTVVTFLPADHFITPINKFKNDLIKAGQIALTDQALVTIGIHPTTPNPSFGYILKNNRFVEKPNKIQALKYIVNGALWNSGIYTATINTYLSEFNKYFPRPNYTKTPSLSFDYAISQKSKIIKHIKASFDWSDVGEWGSIFHLSKHDNHHIATLNSDTKYLTQDSHHCLISTNNQNKLIGLVGVNNLALIDTPNGLLVSALDRCSQVRDLVTDMVKSPKLKKFFVDDEK